MTSAPAIPSAVVTCAKCGTQLSSSALACPACRSLVHATTLRELASSAEQQDAAGELTGARAAWERALELLPPDSQQHTTISARIAELATRIDASADPLAKAKGVHGPWWKRGWATAIAIALLVLTKGKFLLLGLTKAKTFLSMFAFFGVYWNLYGWPLALGLVVSIYIHEMGHVAMLKRLGIDAGAPLFIPGVGALVLLRKHITDPIVDARIGLAGPVWGLGAGVAAYIAWIVTKTPIWGPIAALTGFINLFNLIPIWQLDGSRGFHALSRPQRWMVVGTIALAFALSGQKMLLIVGAVAIWRAFQVAVNTSGDRRTLVTFVTLVAALAWLSTVHSV